MTVGMYFWFVPTFQRQFHPQKQKLTLLMLLKCTMLPTVAKAEIAVTVATIVTLVSNINTRKK